MVSNSVLAMIIIDLFICFILPVVAFIFIQKKYKKTFKAFLLGALAFFVSQIVLRIPIINNFLPQFAWYSVFQMKYPYLFWIFLGLTAGIFEEVARLLIIKFWMKKNQRYIDGIAFGLGHGAIEAMIITGISLINLLIISILINKGALEASFSNLPKATLDLMYTQCSSLTPLNTILGGIERILAMGMHIGFTMIVFEGIRKNKAGVYLSAAILLHGAIDASIGFMTQMFGFSTLAMECVFAVISIGLLFYTYKAKKRVNWMESEE